MIETRLGKIEKCEFGFGGYQNAMIGIQFVLSSAGWGCGDFWGDWSMERTEHCKWTEAERVNHLGEVCMRISQLLSDAKVDSVTKLVGLPIEVTFDGLSLKSWRVLKEVL